MLHILIIEPNPRINQPYDRLYDLYSYKCTITRVEDFHQANKILKKETLDLVMLSTNFPTLQSLEFLERLKNTFDQHVIPVIFSIDWSKRLHQVIGTTWAEKIGVIHTYSSKEELASLLNRLLQN